MGDRFGAYPDEWEHFAETLGAVKDLLPVVCNTGAEISPVSHMKKAGKTPSLYNKDGYIVGIGKWTTRNGTAKKVARWSEEEDYGICLQTRTYRALDIDVPDPNSSREIVEAVYNQLGFKLPMRYRSNSGKCLLLFRMEGEYAKRVLKCGEDIIEFLATGQQCVVAGTNSGARIEWDWHGLEEVPTLTEKQFEAVWYLLQEDYGTELCKIKEYRARTNEGGEGDDVTAFLDANGLVLEYGQGGQAHIECPFADEHTEESSISSTTYFPPGGGYERGHFACLHGHCTGRDNNEFLKAFGFNIASKFEDLEPVKESKEVSTEYLVQPDYEFDTTKGKVAANVVNLQEALSHGHICGFNICYDSFTDDTLLCSLKDEMKFRSLTDRDYTAIQVKLECEQNFAPLSYDHVKRVIDLVAGRNTIDTAVAWLESLEWDGKPRIETFVPKYFGGIDTPYTRAVGLYMWTALAGRIMQPGVKADMVPILKGPQGQMKSTAIAALVPTHSQYVELNLQDSDTELARKMRGKLVAELPELKGLRTAGLDHVKAFVARQLEEWRPVYKEKTVSFARRLLFFGTTNDDFFLADETGNRRWLPFDVIRAIDLKAIKRDRAQLWAEARVLFQILGEPAYEDAERLAKLEHGKYMIRDAWQDVIDDWLHREDSIDGGAPLDRDYLRVCDVAREALNMDVKHIRRLDELKIQGALRNLGYTSRRVWDEDTERQIRAWTRKVV